METQQSTVLTWAGRTIVLLTMAGIASYAVGWPFLGATLLGMMFLSSGLFVLATIADGRHWLVPFIVGRLSERYVPVKLIHRDGRFGYSVATLGLDGYMSCPVYWISNVGRCFLEPNGHVSARSPSSYIKYWTPIYRSDAVLHQLMNDIPDPADLRKKHAANRVHS